MLYAASNASKAHRNRVTKIRKKNQTDSFFFIFCHIFHTKKRKPVITTSLPASKHNRHLGLNPKLGLRPTAWRLLCVLVPLSA